MMPDGVYYTEGDANWEEFAVEWIRLFCECYKVSDKIANSVFQKYRINSPKFCALMNGGKMVACYSGIILSLKGKTIFLSTDTMSDGSVGFATVKLGKCLYEKLKGDGVIAVCGYPNEKIRMIRQRRLGWVMIGQLNCYIGIPFLWRYGQTECSSDLWVINRPISGFFTWSKTVFVPLSRSKKYPSRIAPRIALSAYRPGLFFIRVPTVLVKPKYFGYKMLSDDLVDVNLIKSCLPWLDMDTIDVP
jgi:hypothetical protein